MTSMSQEVDLLESRPTLDTFIEFKVR